MPAQGPESTSPAAAPASPGSSVFYRFEDAQGRVHIVDSLSAVPQEHQSKAVRIELSAPPERQTTTNTELASTPSQAPPALDWPSFGAGFGTAAVLGAALFALRRRGPLPKLAVSLGLAALIGATYLGWLRRETGQSSSPLATPGALVQDARDAVQSLDRRNRQQEQLLEEIRREGATQKR